jgi:hypothetical protein
MDKNRTAFLHRIARLLRHRWAEGGLRQALPPDLLERLGQRVAASERRHTGQIRICIEGGLPLSYLWRGYLLLADHAIEIVADRGLARRVPHGTWQAMVGHMRAAFRAGRYEDGLTQALAEVSALLVAHFPAGDGAVHGNELPDDPVVIG